MRKKRRSNFLRYHLAHAHCGPLEYLGYKYETHLPSSLKLASSAAGTIIITREIHVEGGNIFQFRPIVQHLCNDAPVYHVIGFVLPIT